MITKALLAKLEARPGKEKQVEEFLESALPVVLTEEGTLNWYAVKFGPSTFGIFDTFASDEGRQAHLSGAVAKALMGSAAELLAADPDIVPLDVFAAK